MANSEELNILKTDDSLSLFFDVIKLLKRFNFEIIENAPHMNNLGSLVKYSVENGLLTENEANSLRTILEKMVVTRR